MKPLLPSLLCVLASTALAQTPSEGVASRLYDISVGGVTKQVVEGETLRVPGACGDEVEVRVRLSNRQRFEGFGFTFEYPAGMHVTTKRESIQDVIFVKHPSGFMVALFLVHGTGDPEIETLDFFVRSMRNDLIGRGWKIQRGDVRIARKLLGNEVAGSKLRGKLGDQQMNLELFTSVVHSGIFQVVLQYTDEDATVASATAQSILESIALTGT